MSAQSRLRERGRRRALRSPWRRHRGPKERQLAGRAHQQSLRLHLPLDARRTVNKRRGESLIAYLSGVVMATADVGHTPPSSEMARRSATRKNATSSGG